ncbi:hypothetical protein L218DRAFT_383413 [Marasmius fiardii PR-910]|nr:hypothetical protein L218DRAFT_383413 [Marasmius fiardii PR-910]
MGAAYFFGPHSNLTIFNIVATIVSLVTWIWAAVLLSYNRRPSSKRGITKAAAHFYSLVVLCILWLAVGIMFSTETHFQCTVVPQMLRQYQDLNDDWQLDVPTIWCSVTIPHVAVAFLLFLLTGGAALSIFRTTRQAGGGLNTSNVAQFDGELPEATEVREIVTADAGGAGGSQVSFAV